MAQSRRIEKVAALIRKELSQLLMSGMTNEILQTSMITITKVEVSGDLQHCRIFTSIFGDPDQQEEAFGALQASSGFLKGEIGRRLQMRRTPELVFKLDKGMEKGASVLHLLGKLQEERNQKSSDFNGVEN